MRLWKMALLLSAVVGTSSTSVFAGLLPTTSTSTYDAGTNSYSYTYGVVLTSESTVQKGDYFTVYDFAGYTGSASAPAGWTLTMSNTGTTPSGISVTDSSSTVNLTWTYTGDTTLQGATGQSYDVGTFSASSSDSAGTTSFAGQSHLANGQSDNNVTTTTGPTDSSTPQTPEPATLILLGLALPFVGAKRWMARRNAEN